MFKVFEIEIAICLSNYCFQIETSVDTPLPDEESDTQAAPLASLESTSEFNSIT